MRKITQNELDEIIANHQHYLNKDCKGWENMRANLSECDCSELDFNKARLNEASLERTNLYRASLIGACLDCASLRDASLKGASLNGASLHHASLINVMLDGASLINVMLDGASLINVMLDGASLNGASLCYATLDGATLNGATLNGASLAGTSFNRACLEGALFDDIKGLNIPLACPSEGEFVAYKKCKDNRLVKLLIPADARRSSATTDKCRADKAVVLEITSLDGEENYDEAISSYDYSFIYRVGETVTVADFDENRFNECSKGIHFFVDKQAAIDF